MHASGAGFLFISLLVFATQGVPRACGQTADQRTSDSIEYVVITTNSPDCRLTEAFQGPRLQYRPNATSEWTNLPQDDPVHVGDFTSIQNTRVNVTRFVVDFRNETEPLLREGSELRFVQWEHRGGFCDCWAVANLTINCTHLQSNDSPQCGGRDNKAFFTSVAQNLSFDQEDIVAVFCHDNALAPREFLVSLINPNSPNINCNVIDDSALKVPPTECSDGSELRVEVNFDLKLRLNSSGCEEIDDFNEGVELSFRKLMEGGPGEWIPLMFFANLSTNTQPLIKLPSIEKINNRSTNGTFTLRGYNLTYVIENENYHYNVSVCGESILQYPLQFRWLYSSYQEGNFTRDVVLLDNVTISVRNSTHAAYLLQDCFNCPNFNDHALWDSELSYNVYLLTSTSDEGCRPLYGGALFFYLQPPINFFLRLNNKTVYTISSRELVTKPLDPKNVTFSLINSASLFTCENVSCELTTETEQPTTATVPPTDKESTSEPSTSAASTPSHTAATTLIDGTTTIMTEVSSDSLELSVFNMIRGSLSRLLTQVQNGQPFTNSLSDLNQLLVSGEAVNLTEVMYVFSSILTRFDNKTASPYVCELILQIASRILDIAVNSFGKTNSSEDVAGSTLLQIMDRFALNNHNKSQMVTSKNIVFHVDVVSLNETTVEMISPIEGENAEISIPIREVLKGVEREEQVRMAAFLFRNTSGLLPNRLEGDDKMKNSSNERVLRLASPVISASFQCENCTTSNLSTPVQVTFKHLLYDEALLTNDISAEVTCVYWKFNKADVLRPGAVLFRGQWSSEGCETNFTSTMTVCKCNHLTHFAILLSARPLELSAAKTLALQTIGYIGVSISLVAMAATIFVFLFLKPLRTMRNYIHIQLCITLGIAQIIFVAGIQPRLGDGHLVGGVPVGCRLVAVLLHYWFLVSFMWMLMEGVVLYVALVRVFVKYHARYIVAFTISSYGIPLLYVGGLTIPLGFARSEDIRKNQTYDYGYEQACYLNPATAFIWSIIAPVIVIFLANIGFFIMAVVIMQRHQKRQHTDNTKHKVKHWLKAAVSLTVVMGLTWIIGILIIEVEELCALAFIFTIFVAFQGLFIFVIFILLSKQVRENYAKWWKAKVAESDFLSKHFEKKSFTLGTGTMAQRSGPSTSLAKTNGHTSTASKSTDQQSQVVENSTSDFKSLDLKMDLTNGKVDGDSIEMKRASPNLYVLN